MISLYDRVDERVSNLQYRYLERLPGGRGDLACLRQGVNRELGDIPRLLPLVLDPDAIATAAGPTRYERALYAALTLYAVHQQSKTTAMHRRGTGLGQAMHKVRYSGGGEDPGTVRVFENLLATTDHTMRVRHLRTLVSKARTASVALDYAALAHDLHLAQHARGLTLVRLRWGRDFHRTHATTTD